MSLELRRQVQTEWYECADEILRQAPDQEAIRVLRFVKEKAILAGPRGDQILALESSSNPNWFGLVALIAGDENQGPGWRFQMGRVGGATFDCHQRVMMLKSHAQFTRVWKGLLLLHEGHHAYTYLRQPYDFNDRRTYCVKESETHDYQNRLVRFWAGRPYDEIINQEVTRLEGRSRTQGKNPGDCFFFDVPPDNCLDSVFGPSLSEMEMGVRNAHFMIHAHFEMIARHHKDKREVVNRRAAYLNDLYKTANV